MLMQPLLDQLIQLHLPAFREGLQEQLHNPQYAELSFEERLALLVDREVTLRQDHRLQRRIKLAAFPQSATVEDLDLSPARGLERRFVLELAQSLLDRPASQYPHSWTDRIGKVLPQLCPWNCGLSYRSFRALLPHLPFALPTRTSSCGRFVFLVAGKSGKDRSAHSG